MNDNSAYEKEILNNIKDIEIALRYYIDKNKELESGLEYYKNAYENRVDEFIQRNKDLEEIEKEHKEENGRLREENKKLKKTIVINEQLYTKETKRLANIIQELLEESENNMDSLEVLHKMIIDRARELKLQGKVIYLMADFIEKDDIATEEFICPYCKYQLNRECTEKECIEQIINYFTNKAEEDK